MPVILWYDGPNATGIVLDPIEIPAEGSKAEKIQVITQRIAHAFEEPVRAHSVDWHMMQPVWVADLDPARRSLAETDDGPSDAGRGQSATAGRAE
jgi:lauroyl/myristoyl acyltransferase